MPDFDKDDVLQQTDKAPPPLCEAAHCRSFRRREHDGTYTYGRGFAFTQVHDRSGKRRWVCTACYLRALDRSGESVMAQLLADPESIPSLIREQERERDRAQQDERDYRNRRESGEV